VLNLCCRLHDRSMGIWSACGRGDIKANWG
jgi:hypothetical protein